MTPGLRREWSVEYSEIEKIYKPQYFNKLIIVTNDATKYRLIDSEMGIRGSLPKVSFNPGVAAGPNRILLRLKYEIERRAGINEDYTGVIKDMEGCPDYQEVNCDLKSQLDFSEYN